MIIAVERAAAEALRNVRFINAFADDLASYFAPGEVSRIYLNFCDPWPSNRHAKRRLTHRRFLESYMQVLNPGGEIHFKTDNLPLFEYSLLEFERGGFTLTEVTRDLHKNGPVGVMTDYEMKFFTQGLPINRCAARK
jgi:tRNA (guanine-N7-)-methyltransferase